MNQLNEATLRILDSRHVAIFATTNPDGQPQTSVIFVKQDDNDILFSTIKGRRKAANMLRDPRVNLLLYSFDLNTYATISGTVELVDDPDASFHQVMFDIHMGGATPPPEPGAERVIARLTPTKIYNEPAYAAAAELSEG
jgi:PPOX class probable F420-dependent enzyme